MSDTLGKRITGLLKISKLTQKELADMIGITEVSMSRYINGKRIPKSTVIADMAAALHTTSDYLLDVERTEIPEYHKIRDLIIRNVPHMSAGQKRELVDILLFRPDDKEN